MKIYRLYIAILLLFAYNNYSYSYGEYHGFPYKYVIAKSNNGIRERTISVGLRLVDILKEAPQYNIESVYDEVLAYSVEKPFGDHHGRITNVHETVHGINSILRNKYFRLSKKKVNAFYAGSGKGIVVEDPPIVMRDTIPFIPESVRGYRFDLYFNKQLGDWDSVPTYPIDEWSAYIAGAECAVDDHSTKVITEKSDSVSGVLEFSIYCTALAMSVKERANEYWNTNIQFKHTIKFFLIKSEKVFFEGKDIFPSKEQDKLLLMLRTDPSTEDLRNFLMTEFEGIFVD